MTNSDNGNRPRTAAHHPGDRVRVKHNLRHDHHSYSVEQNRARQALAGQIGSIRERTVAGAYRVAPPGSTERGAWFEADELEPTLPPIGAHVRVKEGLHEGRVLVVKQHRGGEVLAEQGPRMGWYDPSEVEPWVTDADGLPVGGTDAPAVDRPVPELRARVTMSDRAAEALAVLVTELGAGYDASQAGEALRSALTTANAEAQGWHEAAQDARQEAREAKERLAAARSEADALRGKLGAAELKLADALEALATERAAHEETGRLADRWRKERDAALGGAAAKPAERECCWEQTVEQRVSEIEARLGGLESGGARHP